MSENKEINKYIVAKIKHNIPRQIRPIFRIREFEPDFCVDTGLPSNQNINNCKCPLSGGENLLLYLYL